MGASDFFKRLFGNREFNEMRDRYASLDEGQLKVALTEMYERLMFIGKSIKDRGEVIHDLSTNAKDTYVIDNFEMKMNALLSVVKDHLAPGGVIVEGVTDRNGQIPPAPKAQFLDFQGANPKLSEMEAKLMGYGLAFNVPEMEKFSRWRDNQDYEDGPVTLTPFSQHSLRYSNAIATKKDLQDISSPEEIKRTVMSKADIEKSKAEMDKMEYLGGAFVNVVDPAREIIHDLNSDTETFLKKCEENGFKRSDVLDSIKEFIQSDIFKKTTYTDYRVRCDAADEKYPQIKKTGYLSGVFVQIASAISRHEGYMPAIMEFLKEPGNFDKDDKQHGGQENADRLAEYMRRQHRGELSERTQAPAQKSLSVSQMATATGKIGKTA